MMADIFIAVELSKDEEYRSADPNVDVNAKRKYDNRKEIKEARAAFKKRKKPTNPMSKALKFTSDAKGFRVS